MLCIYSHIVDEPILNNEYFILAIKGGKLLWIFFGFRVSKISYWTSMKFNIFGLRIFIEFQFDIFQILRQSPKNIYRSLPP